MKIYQHTPNVLIRLQICRIGEDTQYLNLSDTTKEVVEKMLRDLIEAQNLSPFAEGCKTSINIREAVGGKNLKSKSISFRGLSAKNTIDLIISHVKNNYELIK